MRTRAIAVLLVVVSVPVAGQSPSFEAASIKVNTSRGGNVSMTTTGTQIMGTNVPLLTLIQSAYQVQEYQIVNVPAWATVTRFDILASGDQLEVETARARLQKLLADRFALRARRDTREMPVYALVVARPGVLGPQLKPTSVADCHGGKQFCGTSVGNGTVRAVSVPMTALAATLSGFVGRTVVDRTGLSGSYDADFTWTSDPRRAPSPGDDGPSIFTALQEQLGLKLESQRGPVDVIVIDGVEPPTEN